MKNTEKKTNYNFRIEPSALKKIQEVSDKTGIPIAEIIREGAMKHAIEISKAFGKIKRTPKK